MAFASLGVGPERAVARVEFLRALARDTTLLNELFDIAILTLLALNEFEYAISGSIASSMRCPHGGAGLVSARS